MKKGSFYYNYTLSNEKDDYFYIGTRDNALSINPSSYKCFYADMNCKLKNIINIRKATNLKTFLKKLLFAWIFLIISMMITAFFIVI